MSSRPAPAFSFALVASLLLCVHLKMNRPMLLLERFFPGWAWIEIAALAFYAAWITPKMLDPERASRTGRRTMSRDLASFMTEAAFE